jgi:hypothetical protein
MTITIPEELIRKIMLYNAHPVAEAYTYLGIGPIIADMKQKRWATVYRAVYDDDEGNYSLFINPMVPIYDMQTWLCFRLV